MPHAAEGEGSMSSGSLAMLTVSTNVARLVDGVNIIGLRAVQALGGKDGREGGNAMGCAGVRRFRRTFCGGRRADLRAPKWREAAFQVGAGKDLALDIRVSK